MAKKPASKKTASKKSAAKPGDGLLGWLGRQVGHVKKAVKTDVAGPKVVYRQNKTEEANHPSEPGVKLRRTVIDEVIVDSRKTIAKK
jgi:hypothetical protein